MSTKSDRKFSTGSAVIWHDPERGLAYHATVIRHGRDRNGTYSEIETDDGERVAVHRSSLRDPTEVGVKIGLQHK